MTSLVAEMSYQTATKAEKKSGSPFHCKGYVIEILVQSVSASRVSRAILDREETADRNRGGGNSMHHN